MPDTGGAIYKPETKSVRRESSRYVSVVGQGQERTSRCPENPGDLGDRPGLISGIFYYYLLKFPHCGFWIFQIERHLFDVFQT